MNRALYGAELITSSLIVEPTPTELIAQAALVEIPLPDKRQLIALVGRKGTGKHTYLEEYYQKLGVDKYMPLASTRCVEQNGIHPRDQSKYIETLRCSRTLSLPDTFMFVTHSPYILNAMGWGDVHNVIVFHKNESTGRYYRGTMLGHPLFNKEDLAVVGWAINSTLTLGEFWDVEGEEWLEKYGEDVTRN